MFKQTPLPFYHKLACVLIIILILGYLFIIGQTLIAPIIFGTLIAIFLLPIANYLENKLNIPHSISSFIPIVIFWSLIIWMLMLIGSQMTRFGEDWPAFKEQLLGTSSQLQLWVEQKFGIKYNEQLRYLNETAEKGLSVGTSMLGDTILSISSVLIFLVFTILHTFFLLLYRKHIKNFLLMIFRKDHEPIVLDVISSTQYIVKKYLIGLILQMVIVGILSTIAYSLIGVKYNIVLGVLTGVFNIIPYIGILVSLILASLIALATLTPSHVLLVLFAIVIIHAIDSNYIMPKVVGSKVKINSLVAMIGLVVGEMMWGITGMFLSIPMIAILKIIFDRVHELKAWGYLLSEVDIEPPFLRNALYRISNKKNKRKIIIDKENQNEV
jgi:predicted PurR-regulated permease PerM